MTLLLLLLGTMRNSTDNEWYQGTQQERGGVTEREVHSPQPQQEAGLPSKSPGEQVCCSQSHITICPTGRVDLIFSLGPSIIKILPRIP